MEFNVNSLDELCDAMCDNKAPEGLIKDRECISCEKMFDCKGKPRGVACNCIVPRKDLK